MQRTIEERSGYIGGSEQDVAYGIAVDNAGNAHVTGVTESNETTFPVLIGPDLTFNGAWDAFVTKVNAAGTGLVYSGYIGGSEGDYSGSIALDDFGNAYITGDTASDENSFPVTGGPDQTLDGLVDGYIAKVNTAGTALVYAGYIGGSNLDGGIGIDVDENGNVYIAGTTYSDESSFPVTNGPDLTFNGEEDGFVAKLNPSGADFDYVGYIGGDGSDWGLHIAVDGEGNAYVVGYTTSNETTFPVSVGPDLTHNGSEDGFVTKIALADDPPQSLEIDGPGVGLSGSGYVFTVTTSPVTTMPPLTYTWQATGQTPVTHTTNLTDTAVFTWTTPGPKTITVTASNTIGTVTNTHPITIYEPVTADFTAAPTTGPTPLNVTFTNLSTGSYTTCLWDFGDGNTSDACNPIHQYTTPGLYTITLTVTGPGGTDTHTKTNHITIHPALYLPTILKS